MTEFPVLPFGIEDCITRRTTALFSELKIDDVNFDVRIRDNIFDVLDRFCVVLYYPLSNDENNGFHIKDMPFANGSKKDFVFINTAQTIEKQVFTAAHELGHIWKIDDYVLEETGFEEIEMVREKIINRFAAALLMPSGSFRSIFIKEFNKLSDCEGKISIIDLIKLIVLMMNYFFAPKKAVILRLAELDFINEDEAIFLIENSSVEELIHKFILELGFHNLELRTGKKWIEGLACLLDVADSQMVFPQRKIDYLRNKFNLGKQIEFPAEFTDTLSLNSFERYDT